MQLFKCCENDGDKDVKALSAKSLVDSVNSLPEIPEEDLVVTIMRLVHSDGICLHKGYKSTTKCNRYSLQFTLHYIKENDFNSPNTALGTYKIVYAKIQVSRLQDGFVEYANKKITFFQCVIEESGTQTYDVLIIGHGFIPIVNKEYYTVVHTYTNNNKFAIVKIIWDDKEKCGIAKSKTYFLKNIPKPQNQ